jgi:hypothetical protein
MTLDDTEERIRRLGQFLPRMELGFDFGHWAGGETQADGSITMPYYVFSEQASELIAALPVVPGFAWPDWVGSPEAQSLLTDHARIEEATAEQLAKLTTAIVRSDRFTEGSIAGTFESGLLAAIVRRARALTVSAG